MSRHFSKENIQMTNRLMRRCSNHKVLEKRTSNHTEASPHTYQNGYCHLDKKINVRKNMEKREP